MLLSDAQAIAAELVAILAPSCARIEIAGGVRRRKPEPHDIEIVCIPKLRPSADLFGVADDIRVASFAEAVNAIGALTKGDPQSGKFIQVLRPPAVQVDIFVASPENWGLVYAVRTGSAEFSHRVLACGWVRAGYHSINGMLCDGSNPIPIREERDLFELIGVPYIEPEERV